MTEQESAAPFAAALADTQRQVINFNKDWRFEKGENKGADAKDFDDGGWRMLNLPHDYSVENDFNRDSPSQDGGGYLDGGPAWYRKTCVLPADMAGKRISVDFEGVYMNSKVYVNGTLMGEYPYGYSPFSYDITDYVVADGMTENVIAVYTNNVQPSSRWYSGSGIYRDVTMTVTEPVHVARYGVYVKTPNVETEYNNGTGPVTVGIDTKVENETDAETTVTVRHTTHYKGNLNGGGSDAVVATKTTAPVSIAPGATVKISSELSIANPQLWELGVGGLYGLKTEVLVDGVVRDTYDTDYGLRWMDFTPDGFFLNGEYTKMRGVCQHHDQGALGAVNNQNALDRQIRILREAGVNSIRSSHNPASRALLNACNEQGIMVMNEAFDTWYNGKNKNDFHLFFDSLCTHPDAKPGQTWPEFDIKNMIEGAKNDPSIIMWSVGNEIEETWDEKGRDTGMQLADWVREIDPQENNSRAVTMADPFPYSEDYIPAKNSDHWQLINDMDTTGFNYGTYDTYDKVHEYNPDWFIYSSETSSAVSTRGEYFHPERDHGCEMPLTTHGGSRQCSEFDNDHVAWGTTLHYALKEDIQRKYMGGVFFWTGFDYLGEPSPSKPYQAKSSYFGFVDTCGFPKDSFYMLQSQWLDAKTDPMVHIFPHWNWENDDSILIDGKIPLRVYSNAASVELILNGESLGEKKSFVQEAETETSLAWQHDGTDQKNLYLEWLVKYEPGTVEAVAYDKDGKVIARDVKKTAGAPAAIKMTPERSVITADGEDLAYIAVDIVDKDGVMNPDADNNIQFSISGNGRIVGTDNGNPLDWTNMKSENRSAFNGKAMVIVQSTTNSGSFTVTATSAGLPISSTTVYTQAPEGGDSGEILGYDAVSGKTTVNVQPILPETVTARYADGTKAEKSVTWKNASAADLAQAGYITVSGTVETGAAITASVLVVAPVGVQPVSVMTSPGVQPRLPAKVKLVNSDGTSTEHGVTWETIENSKLVDGAAFTVEGTLADPAWEATAHVRVALPEPLGNVALASKGFATFDAQYISPYDPISHINDGITSYTESLKNGWGSWHGMGTGKDPAETHWLKCTFAEELPLDNITFCFREDDGIYVPKNTILEYWDGSAWQPVANQSRKDGFVGGKEETITFNSVTTNQLRAVFTRGNQTGDDGTAPDGKIKDCVVITEVEIEAIIPARGNTTANLASLTVGSTPVFDSAKTVYTVVLPYGAEIPQVTATGADNATVLVLPAVSNNSAAIVRVTSENGKTTRDYAVQFVEEPAAIESAALRLEKDGAAVTDVIEDDVLTIHVDATLEDGATVDPDLLDVKYTLSNAGDPAKAAIRDGQLYAYKAGQVTLTANIRYRGEKKPSAPLTVTILPSENKKSILSYSPITVTTKLGVEPTLPGVVRAKFDLGLAQDVAVVWDTIAPSQYARYGSFTVSGTVAGQALRPTATVLVRDFVAAENRSMATPVGIQPTLPETVKVYSSDGNFTYSGVTWNGGKPNVSAEGTVIVNGTTELGAMPVTLTLRVTNENVIRSDNHAQLRTGFKYSLAFADFTESAYDAANLNNGKTDDKWCTYGVSAGEQQHIGVVFGKDNPSSRYVDTVKLYMRQDTNLGRTGIKECTVQYYQPEFGIDDAPTDASNMRNQPGHPLNNNENWADVENQTQITAKPGNESTEGIFVIGENTLTFDMVDTYALRLKLTTLGNNGATYYLALGELEAYGKSAKLNTDFTVSGITAGSAPVAGFDPATKEYTVTIPGTEVPALTATASNNASVTVLPAPNIDGKSKIFITSEDGLKTETYTISFESTISRYHVAVNGGVAYRAVETFALNEIVEKYAEGEAVTVVADAAPNFQAFDKWVVSGLTLTEEEAEQSTMTFTMPGSDVTFTATYKERELTDAEIVANAKAKVGTGIVLPYGTYADENAMAEAATQAVQALIGDEVTAVVRYESGAFVLTFAKGASGATVKAFDVTVAAPPYTGGGSSNTTTKTEKNPDGSTTKTVTDKKTGNVTETTTYPDGTKIVATTPKDGKASIEVTVPKGKDSVTVTIPTTEQPKAGEVAVIIREDGTREVVKTSVSTKDGLRVTLTGNAKLEIVDNSKSFADVPATHWGADAIAFVTSRELFNGGDGGFQPAGDMSRAMLFTVLARLDGQDVTGGETWYSAAMDWAKETGISDGTNPEASITRESLAVMLYRYAGSPEVGGMALGEFSDAESISAWASDAMLWCVDSGILNGSGGKLNPSGTASRTEVATMLQRFITTAQ